MESKPPAPQPLQHYARRILQRMDGGTEQLPALPGLTLYRFDQAASAASYVLQPSICFILQGSKDVQLGKQRYSYDSSHFLVTPIDLPVIAEVHRPSPGQPYLGLALQLDRQLASHIILQETTPTATARHDSQCIEIAPLTHAMESALCRLLDLLEEPAHIPVLAPLIQQEILYRVLISPAGPKLRQIIASGQRSHQISKIIEAIKNNLSEPLRVEELASQHGMSPSTLHSHFKALTAMSPLQYQKHLRLNAARGLMLNQRIDAANAAFQVGYESPSQFSREYSRLFGAPPLRDIKNISSQNPPAALSL